jgi:O-antigen/teichoic acid export membrane protein
VLAGSRKLTFMMAVIVPSFAAIAAPLLPVLYGAKFIGAVGPLLVLLAATFVLSLSFPFITALTGTGRTGKVALVSWTALPVTVGLDIALIPHFGALGASIASVAAYSTVTVAAYVQWRLGLPKSEHTTLRELIPRSGDARALVAPLRRRIQRMRDDRRGDTSSVGPSRPGLDG